MPGMPNNAFAKKAGRYRAFEPIDLPGQIPVADDKVDVIGSKRLQRLAGVARGERVMTEAGERLREHAANGRILVDEEDSGHSRRDDDRAGP